MPLAPRHPAASQWDPAGPKRPSGAVLPSLPPHATSPRAKNATLSSFALGPADDPTSGGWLHCWSGGNQLPLAQRLQAAAGAELRLGTYTACARQLMAKQTQLVTQGQTAFEGLPAICAALAKATGAEAAAVLPVAAFGLDVSLSEHNFTAACQQTLAAAPPCVRLAASLHRELRSAAERRCSLNLGGGVGVGGGGGGGGGGAGGPPAALEVGQVALRESESVGGALLKVSQPALSSALVTPVADSRTGSTVALLVCCNARLGRFSLADELFAEAAALHAGLTWVHHLHLLRLMPLPGAPLPPRRAAP